MNRKNPTFQAEGNAGSAATIECRFAIPPDRLSRSLVDSRRCFEEQVNARAVAPDSAPESMLQHPLAKT